MTTTTNPATPTPMTPAAYTFGVLGLLRRDEILPSEVRAFVLGYGGSVDTLMRSYLSEGRTMQEAAADVAHLMGR